MIILFFGRADSNGVIFAQLYNIWWKKKKNFLPWSMLGRGSALDVPFWFMKRGHFIFGFNLKKSVFDQFSTWSNFKKFHFFLCLLLLSIRGVRKSTFYLPYIYLVVIGWVKKSKFWTIFDWVEFFLELFFLSNSMVLNSINFFFDFEQNSSRKHGNTRNKNRVFWFIGFFWNFLCFFFKSNFRFGISIKFCVSLC